MMSRSSLVVPLCLLAVCSSGAAAQALDFDPVPTILSASELEPAEVRKGDHHEVMSEVENDGYMNSYRIASDFGRFDAYGTVQLALRVIEIGALAELDELSKTQVFAEAAKKSAMSSVDTIEQFADKPVETMKGIPSGAKRMFKVTKRRAKDLKEDAEEEYEERKAKKAEEEAGEGEEDGGPTAEEVADDAADAGSYLIKRYFGITAAERRWAQKLGVDPYTSNEVLRKEIKEVARIDSAGRFGVKLLPIPSIPGVSVIRTVNTVVWSKDPYELQDYNRARLLSIGADEALVDAFFEVPWLSPSAQTIFVSALSDLEEAKDRPLAVEQVLGLESLDEGRFLVQAAQMLAWVNEKEEPVVRLLPGERTLVALTKGQREIIPLPVDHLLWTPELAALIERRGAELDRPGLESRELWMFRTVSDLCREELEARNWEVEVGLGERMNKDPRVAAEGTAPSAP
jgi:hypothetical protein